MEPDFRELLVKAKNGDEDCFSELLVMYKPLLLRGAVVGGVYDEDLYQENCLTFLKCVRTIGLTHDKFMIKKRTRKARMTMHNHVSFGHHLFIPLRLRSALEFHYNHGMCNPIAEIRYTLQLRLDM